MFAHEQTRQVRAGLRGCFVVLCAITFLPCFSQLRAQAPTTQELADKIEKLTESMSQAQAQLEESQRQLDAMRQQLNALQLQMAAQGTSTAASQASSSSAASSVPASVGGDVQAIREQQAIDESQIATHEQTKVESASKYPIKINGLLLFNGFVNASGVDMPATPTLAVAGPGTTGATVRQTVLGIDATGPHLLGARSYADLRVDFSGASQSAVTGTTAYAGPYAGDALLRLRTAHAGLLWQSSEVYFSLDRPILSPDTPTSLTAVAAPALAWSGNLWTWNPQLGVTQDVHFAQDRSLRLQAALIDVGDAPLTLTVVNAGGGLPANTSEKSRWPGVEARVSLYGSTQSAKANHIGVGGYFSPHSALGFNFNAWAATFDAQLRLPARLLFTGSFYRGAALGGLGAGAYKDYTVYQSGTSGRYFYRAPDDVGGWAQLKESFSDRWQANVAFGLDNLFARQLYRYSVAGGGATQNLARNSTFTGNIIFSPSAYLLFSIEYRHLFSAPIFGAPATSNVIGLGAGYKF